MQQCRFWLARKVNPNAVHASCGRHYAILPKSIIAQYLTLHGLPHCYQQFMLHVQQEGLQPAQEEQQQILKQFGSELSLEALNHMEVLQRNITEALRINPPLTLLMRQVKKSFAVTTSSGKTHIIPKASISLCPPSPYPPSMYSSSI